jgi:surface protein
MYSLVVSSIFFAAPASAYGQDSFVVKYHVTDTTTPIEIGLYQLTSGASFSVNWGDATTNSSLTHTYSAAGDYFVEITTANGSFTKFTSSYTNSASKAALIELVQWGNFAITDMYGAFSGSANLTAVPSTIPAGVTNMSYMFFGASTFNDDISLWTTNAVTDMSLMFAGATAFNQNIGSWTTNAVTDMSFMFAGATAFNQNIGSWNTSNVTDMTFAFWSATAFNQDISNWNTSNVTDMNGIFASAYLFNQNIGSWNTSNVTDMTYAFWSATAFNQDISNWNISALTDANAMFDYASAYSSTNYSKLLRQWNASTHLNNVAFRAAQTAYFNTVTPQRAELVSDGWAITDAGQVSALTPTVTTNPTASSITTGQDLSHSTLTGGSASVPGVFSFTSPSVAPPQGTATAAVTFTPTDTITYLPISTVVFVTVNAPTPPTPSPAGGGSSPTSLSRTGTATKDLFSTGLTIFTFGLGILAASRYRRSRQTP